MKICRNCYKENPSESQFCMDCGIKLENKTTRTCTNCGNENSIEAQFCSICGNKLINESKEETKKELIQNTFEEPEKEIKKETEQAIEEMAIETDDNEEETKPSKPDKKPKTKKVKENKPKKSVKNIFGIIVFLLITGALSSFYFFPKIAYSRLWEINEKIKLHELVDIVKDFINGFIDLSLPNCIIPIVIDAIALCIIIGIIIIIFNKWKSLKTILNIAIFIAILYFTVTNPPTEYYRPVSQFTSTIVSTETVTINESETEQTIEVNNITIDIPSYFVKESGSITVDELVFSDNMSGYDITLTDKNGENIHMLNLYIEISISSPSESLEDISYDYYDTKDGKWHDVAWYYNTEKDKIILLTNHLTQFKKTKNKEDKDLLKILPTPVFEYSPTRGVYVKGSIPQEFSAESLKEDKTTYENVVKYVDGLKIASPILKIAGSVRSSMYQDGTDAINKFLKSKGVESKKLEKFIDASGNTLASGAEKTWDVFTYVDFLTNAFTYYDQMQKGEYKEASITSGISASSLFFSKFGPYGFAADAVFMVLDTARKEYNFYTVDDTMTAYYSYYNSFYVSGKPTGYPASHWYYRFDEIMKDHDPVTELKLGVELLDAEMNEYLHEFWKKENEQIRKDLGAWGTISLEDQEAIVNTYKKEAHIYELQQSIVERYIEKLKKRKAELLMLTIQSYYEDILNKIIEIDIDIEGYNTEKSFVQVEADAKELWKGNFDKDGKCEFRSRYHFLIPQDINSIQTITIWTTLVDKYGVESQKQEEIHLLDLGNLIELEYSNDVSYDVKITDRNVSMNLDESYQFRYEYDNNGKEYRIPDRIEWIASNGSIDNEGWYTPAVGGSHTITFKAHYDAEGIVVDDSVTVKVEEETVVEEPPTDEPPAEEQPEIVKFRAGVYGEDGESIEYMVDFGDGHSGSFVNHCNHEYTVDGSISTYSITFTSKGYETLTVNLSPSEMGTNLKYYLKKEGEDNDVSTIPTQETCIKIGDELVELLSSNGVGHVYNTWTEDNPTKKDWRITNGYKEGMLFAGADFTGLNDEYINGSVFWQINGDNTPEQTYNDEIEFNEVEMTEYKGYKVCVVTSEEDDGVHRKKYVYYFYKNSLFQVNHYSSDSQLISDRWKDVMDVFIKHMDTYLTE